MERKHSEADVELPGDDAKVGCDRNPERKAGAKCGGGGAELFAAIDALEGLLLPGILPDQIYLGEDDDGDAKEDDPPTALFKAVRRICKRALPSFVQMVEEGGRPGEFRLDQTEAHSDFVAAVEAALEDRLSQFGYDQHSFVRDLRDALEWREVGGHDPERDAAKYATAAELLDIIEIVRKFTNFAMGMKIKAQQYLNRHHDDHWEDGRC